MRYSDWEQRQMDIESGQELDRHAARKADRQVDIRSASYRILDETPGHVRFGIWVNGGKCGDLTVRHEESVGFREMLDRAGFNYYG
jgi:hypothetical protein